MLRVSTLLFVLWFSVGLSHGMECSLGHQNFVQKIINSCPGILDPSDHSFCCMDFDRTYCCDAVEFAVKSSWMILGVVITVVSIVLLIVFFISCLCCSCCPWHRRRHQGTVYGHVQGPSSIVHVIQTPANAPVPTQQHLETLDPTRLPGMVPSPYSAAPVYTSPVYEKQAPYNPNYVNLDRQ